MLSLYRRHRPRSFDDVVGQEHIVRTLRNAIALEKVALAPMGGGKRIYILDEAHMLSPSAWNAFLKTLEEPPSHVVFVLATTEAHKVPATIVDRCHRFDFGRPSLEQLVTYGGPEVALDDVLENLGVADLELIFEATDALADKDARGALLAV